MIAILKRADLTPARKVILAHSALGACGRGQECNCRSRKEEGREESRRFSNISLLPLVPWPCPLRWLFPGVDHRHQRCPCPARLCSWSGEARAEKTPALNISSLCPSDAKVSPWWCPAMRLMRSLVPWPKKHSTCPSGCRPDRSPSRSAIACLFFFYVYLIIMTQSPGQAHKPRPYSREQRHDVSLPWHISAVAAVFPTHRRCRHRLGHDGLPAEGGQRPCQRKWSGA